VPWQSDSSVSLKEIMGARVKSSGKEQSRLVHDRGRRSRLPGGGKTAGVKYKKGMRGRGGKCICCTGNLQKKKVAQVRNSLTGSIEKPPYLGNVLGRQARELMVKAKQGFLRGWRELTTSEDASPE